jgi:hypothetical protein
MIDTFSSILGGVSNALTKDALSKILRPLVDRFSSQATSTAGLVISTTTTTSKIGAVAFAGVANGVPVAIAAGTDMPALTGLNITAGSYNVFCYFIDSASVVTVKMGIEGTTLAKVKFPQFPEGKALVGYLVVTYASAFTGGTTVLSTATTVYVSPVGAIDPTYVL